MKHLKNWMYWICACSLLLGCSSSPKNVNEPTIEDNSGFSKNESVNTEKTGDVVIVSWNDFHGGIFEVLEKEEGIASGGLTWFMSAVRHAKETAKYSVVLDAGDMFQGSKLINDSKGQGAIEIMNALGIDATTIGNHEFDYADYPNSSDPIRGSLVYAMKNSNFSWLSANILPQNPPAESPWPPEHIKPWTMIEKGDYKIAVIGVSTLETTTTTVISRLQGLRFEPVTETLIRWIPEIAKEKPDYTIVLGHLTGTCNPSEVAGEPCIFDGEIAEILNLPTEILSSIDALITGHSHEPMLEVRNGVTISQTESSGRMLATHYLVWNGEKLVLDSSRKPNLWRLTHKAVDPGCGDAAYPLDSLEVGGVPLSPATDGLEIIRRLDAGTTTNRCELLGCIESPIIRTDVAECALGNFVADAMLRAEKRADIAVQNSGGLRMDLMKDKLYREDLDGLMPFENFNDLVEMPGSDIAKMLKLSIVGSHGMLQVAGMEYSFAKKCDNPEDLDENGIIESWENNCLCSVRIKDEPLDENKKYKVAINSFLFEGGDGLEAAFKNSKHIERGVVIKTVIEDYALHYGGCLSADKMIDKDKPRIIVRDSCM